MPLPPALPPRTAPRRYPALPRPAPPSSAPPPLAAVTAQVGLAFLTTLPSYLVGFGDFGEFSADAELWWIAPLVGLGPSKFQ